MRGVGSHEGGGGRSFWWPPFLSALLAAGFIVISYVYWTRWVSVVHESIAILALLVLVLIIRSRWLRGGALSAAITLWVILLWRLTGTATLSFRFGRAAEIAIISAAVWWLIGGCAQNLARGVAARPLSAVVAAFMATAIQPMSDITIMGSRGGWGRLAALTIPPLLCGLVRVKNPSSAGTAVLMAVEPVLIAIVVWAVAASSVTIPGLRQAWLVNLYLLGDVVPLVGGFVGWALCRRAVSRLRALDQE